MGDVLVHSQSRQQKTNEIKVISLHLRARTAGNCQYNNLVDYKKCNNKLFIKGKTTFCDDFLYSYSVFLTA